MGECILGADRFSDSVSSNLAVVDAARYPVVMASGLAEIGLHEFDRLVAQVEAGVETECIHLCAGRWSDTVKLVDRQAFDECAPHLRCDDVLAIRLAVVGSELRQKFVIGDAGGGVEVGFLFDLGTDCDRYVARKRNALQVFRDVKVCFVQRQWFNDGRVLREDLADLLGNGLVDFEAGLYEDEVRALPLGSHRRHRRPNPELPRFVARGRHDAALAGSSDGNWLTADIRIVPLLDGRIEGIHVDMDDLALRGRGPRFVVAPVRHVVGPAGSSLTPRATIRSVTSVSGRWSFRASSAGAVIQVSTSSSF